MTRPDSTRSAGPCSEEPDVPVVAVVPLVAAPDDPFFSSVPVSSSFLPTCGVSADGFAISRKVCPPASGVEPLGAAPAVGVSGVEPGAAAGFIVASASTYFASLGSAALAAPAVPAVPVVPVVPAVPAPPAVASEPGAARRHPTIVTF